MPVERLGGDAERAIGSVLAQETPFPFELIVVSATPLSALSKTGVRNVVEVNRNPATRRNRAVSEACGEILAFIDDDAMADPQSMLNGFNVDVLLDLLAQRVAEKMRSQFDPALAGCGIVPRLLSVEQAAIRIGRSKEAVQHMVASRKLPTVRDGRRVFLDIEDLDRWIEANKEPARD